MTDDSNSLMVAAGGAYTSRNYPLAEELWERVLKLDPQNRQAFLFQSLAIAKQHRTDEGINRLLEFLTIEPTSSVALNWLSKLYRESGQISAALTYAEKAAGLSSDDADIAYNLGLCYFATERFEQAIFWLRKSTGLADRFGAGYYALACLYETMGQPWQALAASKKNVRIDPVPEGFLKLGQLSLSVGKIEDAIECGQKAVIKPPIAGKAHLLLADAFADLDPEQSALHLKEAVKIDPAAKAAFSNARSKKLSRLGRIEEAIPIYEQAIEDDPNSGAAYLNLVTVKKITDEDRGLVTRMESVLQNENLPPAEQIYLQFALAKSFDDIGEYELAMRHYDHGNALQLEKNPALARFDRDRFARKIDSLIALFTPEFVTRNAKKTRESALPIFIVGMMRSGTTLAEQILSRHTKVSAGGELAYWTYAERKIVDFVGCQFGRADLEEATGAYLEILRTIDPTAEHVTDKNPANCFALGLISIAFPSAHVIHMDRDPVETALSIYITPMRNPPEFGCDRDNIAFAVRETARLSKHWEEVLPCEHFHRIRYEDLVYSQEPTTRRLIKECGLAWEDACLHPEDGNSLVGTPSLWQVRQPVNAGVANRSKNYLPWLEALGMLR